jgi:hypothetical protein
MGRYQKLLQHILIKKGDANVPFDGLCQLLCRDLALRYGLNIEE